MAKLIRFDPLRELETLHHAMDDLFDNSFSDRRRMWSQSMSMPLDVVEHDDAYLIKASLPGINPDDLEVTFENNVLTIKGVISEQEETESARYHLRERRFGEFSRSVSLPTSIDDNGIEADYEAGVLTLRLPKSEEAKPKRISVRSNDRMMIEG